MLIIYSNVKCDWKVPSTPVFVFSSLRDSKILTGVTLVGTISEIKNIRIDWTPEHSHETDFDGISLLDNDD